MMEKREKIIDWVKRKQHPMEQDGVAPAVPRDPPEGIETLLPDVIQEANLDAVGSNQVIVHSHWLGTPEQMVWREAMDAKLRALRREYRDIERAERNFLGIWFDMFHTPDPDPMNHIALPPARGPGQVGMYVDLLRRRQELIDEIHEKGDVDFLQHIEEDKHAKERDKRYCFEVDRYNIFGFFPWMDIAYKPYWDKFPLEFNRKRYEDDGGSKENKPLKSTEDVCDWLKAHKHIDPFLQPISDDDAPGYSTIIKCPMSLTKLEKGNYISKIQFIKSVRLIFDNCRLYNDSDSDVVAMANELETDLLHALEGSPEFADALESLFPLCENDVQTLTFCSQEVYPFFGPDYLSPLRDAEEKGPVAKKLSGAQTASKLAGDYTGTRNKDQDGRPSAESQVVKVSITAAAASVVGKQKKPDITATRKRARVEDSDNLSELSSELSELSSEGIAALAEEVQRNEKRQKIDTSKASEDTRVPLPTVPGGTTSNARRKGRAVSKPRSTASKPTLGSGQAKSRKRARQAQPLADHMEVDSDVETEVTASDDDHQTHRPTKLSKTANSKSSFADETTKGAPSKQPSQSTAASSSAPQAASSQQPSSASTQSSCSSPGPSIHSGPSENSISTVDIGFALLGSKPMATYTKKGRGERPWFFDHRSTNGYAIYALKCPKSRCLHFNKHPSKKNRAVDHLTACGVPFTDEDDIVRQYATQVIYNPPGSKSQQLSITWARSENNKHPVPTAAEKAADNFPET